MPIRDTNALGDVLLGDALRGQDGAQAIMQDDFDAGQIRLRLVRTMLQTSWRHTRP